MFIAVAGKVWRWSYMYSRGPQISDTFHVVPLVQIVFLVLISGGQTL